MNREYKSVRSEYGKTLVELGKINKDIVVLDADLSSSTQTKLFAKEFPERFFNVGIAEQDLITTAAGLLVQVRYLLYQHLQCLHLVEPGSKLEILFAIQT